MLSLKLGARQGWTPSSHRPRSRILQTLSVPAQALLYHLSVLEDGGAAVDRARWKAQQLRDGCARSLCPRTMAGFTPLLRLVGTLGT